MKKTSFIYCIRVLFSVKFNVFALFGDRTGKSLLDESLENERVTQPWADLSMSSIHYCVVYVSV